MGWLAGTGAGDGGGVARGLVCDAKTACWKLWWSAAANTSLSFATFCFRSTSAFSANMALCDGESLAKRFSLRAIAREASKLLLDEEEAFFFFLLLLRSLWPLLPPLTPLPGQRRVCSGGGANGGGDMFGTHCSPPLPLFGTHCSPPLPLLWAPLPPWPSWRPMALIVFRTSKQRAKLGANALKLSGLEPGS